MHPYASSWRPGMTRGLLRAQSGSSVIEFALLAPVMIVLLTGSYDITQAMIALRQVTSTAQTIVEIATQLSIQRDQSMSLTTNQAYRAQTAIFALMPSLRRGPDSNEFSVTLSAVVFAAVPAGCVPGVDCTYLASTAWSTALPEGLQVTRACGVVAQVAPAQQTSVNELPTAGMRSVTSLVVADVSYIYRPLFSSFIAGSIKLQRTAFLPPRSGKSTQYVQYDAANHASNKAVCPGFL
jgi:hypothetical protein